MLYLLWFPVCNIQQYVLILFQLSFPASWLINLISSFVEQILMSVLQKISVAMVVITLLVGTSAAAQKGCSLDPTIVTALVSQTFPY